MRTMLLAGLLLAAPLLAAAPVGSAINYQGELRENGQPASGSYDLQFQLFDSPAGGMQTGVLVEKADVAVAAGRLQLELDFGNAQFAGDAQWLELRVRGGSSTGAYTTLQPRQPILAVPYAHGARHALLDSVTGLSVVDGSIGAADIDPAQVQTRIQEACPAGLSLRGFGPSGAALCNDAYAPIDTDTQGAGAQTTFVVTKLMMSGGAPVGFTSRNIANGSYVFVRCDDATCIRNSAPVTMVSPNGTTTSSDAVLINGRPGAAVSYGGNLHWVLCNDAACSGVSDRTLAVSDGQGVSVARTMAGAPVIAYGNFSSNLSLYICSDIGCLMGVSRPLQAVGYERDVHVRPDGRPIVFFQSSGGTVAAYDCADTTCSSGSVITLDASDDVGRQVNAARTPAGGWLVTYSHAGAARAYECADVNCSTGTSVTIAAGYIADLAVARSGAQPLLTLTERETFRDFLVACGGPQCTPRTLVPLGSDDIYDVQVRQDGRPVMVRATSEGNTQIHTCGATDCTQ